MRKDDNRFQLIFNNNEEVRKIIIQTLTTNF